MIRKVELQDTRPLTDIYNYYIAHSTATFDITPIGEEEMRKRIGKRGKNHGLLLCASLERKRRL